MSEKRERDWAADRMVCEAATPPPWEYSEYDWRGRVQDRFWYVSGDVREMEPDYDLGETDEDVEGRLTAVGVLRVERNQTSHPVCENNARFITMAREGWPAALDEIERQRARAERAEAKLAELVARS